MEFGGTKKRSKVNGGINGNGGFKKSRKEMESFTTGIGSKSKPCTKFFSISGCPFGEGCHFLHYVPGGIKAVSQMLDNNPSIARPVSFQDVASPPSVKTRLCNKFSSPEGCKFGDKCHFAHGERQLGKPSLEDPRAMGPGRYGMEPTPARFGVSATAKISIDAAMAGPVIGKDGVNSKQICRLTGAKFSVRDHETDPNLRNIELEGTFEQIKHASEMVRELIMNVSALSAKHSGGMPSHAPGGSNFKTKLCENFSKGSCTFGDRCHFAHGSQELRTAGVGV